MNDVIVITDTLLPLSSIKEKLKTSANLEIINYSKFQYSPHNFYFLDLTMINEGLIIKQIKQNGGKLGKNYMPIWVHQSEIKDNLYSFIKISPQFKTRTAEYIADTLKGMKKMCCIYGNCQITVLSQLLCDSKKFCEEYVVIQLPEVFKIEEWRNSYYDISELLPHVDLFIYQHIKKDNRFGEKMSTDILCSYLSENCKTICFPNAYVGFYYPQITKVKGERVPEDTIMPYGDMLIQNNVKCDSFSELISTITSESCYSQEDIEKIFDDSIKELTDREKYCDVIISDYIFDNYKNKCLGYSPNHPINDVLEEVAKRILLIINVKVDSLTCSLALNQFEMIIYPSVSKHLGLSFIKNTFVFNRGITPKPLSIQEYVRYYLYYTNPTLFYGKLIDIDLSPALSISKSIRLLENKTVMMQNQQVYLNITFRTVQKERIDIHLPCPCCPTNVVYGVCFAEKKNYLVKLDKNAHIKKTVDEEGWIHLNMIYLVV